MEENAQETEHTVKLPQVTREQAANAYVAIASLQERYGMKPEDQDALFAAHRLFVAYLLQAHGCLPEDAGPLVLSGLPPIN